MGRGKGEREKGMEGRRKGKGMEGDHLRDCIREKEGKGRKIEERKGKERRKGKENRGKEREGKKERERIPIGLDKSR